MRHTTPERAHAEYFANTDRAAPLVILQNETVTSAPMGVDVLFVTTHVVGQTGASIFAHRPRTFPRQKWARRIDFDK